MGKGLSYLKHGGIGVNYCWNYRPSKLLLHFIESRLDQRNNKHTKAAVNSTIQKFEDFWSTYRKRTSLKNFCEIERKPSFIGQYFSNFTNIRHLVYWKCVIWAKSDLPLINSVCVYDWKCYFSIFCFFVFPTANDYCQKYYGKTILFYNGFRGFLWSSVRHKYFWSTFFWQWNNSSFKIFWNFHGNKCIFFLYFF